MPCITVITYFSFFLYVFLKDMFIYTPMIKNNVSKYCSELETCTAVVPLNFNLNLGGSSTTVSSMLTCNIYLKRCMLELPLLMMMTMKMEKSHVLHIPIPGVSFLWRTSVSNLVLYQLLLSRWFSIVLLQHYLEGHLD